MGVNESYAPAIVRLSDVERKFVLHYIEFGNAEQAKAVSGYHTTVLGSQLLHRPSIAAAMRAEVARQMATDGARIGYGCLKRIAKDTKAPAAAQVAAAKALLQGAGLLDAPDKPTDSKPLTEYSREELRDYIVSKQTEIERMEAELAARATDITPVRDSEPQKAASQAIDPFE